MKNRHNYGSNRTKPLLFVAGLLLVAGASAQISNTGGIGSVGSGGNTPVYRTAPHHFIVSFQPGTSTSFINSLVKKYGLAVDANHTNKYFTRIVLNSSHIQAGIRPEVFIQSFEMNPAVMYAEQDVEITPDYVPNDPQFAQQWFHNNTGQNGGTPDADVDSVEAWDDLANIAETVVAVCDDGVDLDHEDLAASIWVNPGEIPGNSIDDDGNGFVDDINGWDTAANDNDPRPEGGDTHGTHVAGIVNAVQDNGIGVSGVAPKAKIMAMRHYAGQGSWMSDLATAIDYAWANGADVITVSYNVDGFNNTLVQAIQRADTADVVYLNSAGNNGQQNPPRQQIRNMADNVIFVAATDRNDNKANFSNWGNLIEVGAPGAAIRSTVVGGYANFDGTSMATPLAAGIVANIRGKFPTISDREALDILIDSCDQVASLSNTIPDGRRVNNFNALQGVVASTNITDMQMLLGTLMTGDLTALEDSDDVYVSVDSEVIADRGQYSAFELTVASPKNNVDIKSMKIDIESSADQEGVVQFVTAYNFDTGKWDMLSSQRAGTVDSVTNIVTSKNKVKSYIDPNTQEAKIRVEAYTPYKRRGTFPAQFNFNVDQVVVRIG